MSNNLANIKMLVQARIAREESNRTLKGFHAILTDLLNVDETHEKLRAKLEDKHHTRAAVHQIFAECKKLLEASTYIPCVTGVCEFFKIPADDFLVQLQSIQKNDKLKEFCQTYKKELTKNITENQGMIDAITRGLNALPPSQIPKSAPTERVWKTYRCGDLVITYGVTDQKTVVVTLDEFWRTHCQTAWHKAGFLIFQQNNGCNVTFCRTKGEIRLKDGTTQNRLVYNRDLERAADAHVTTVVPVASVNNYFRGQANDKHSLEFFFHGSDLTDEVLLSLFETHLLALDSDGKPKLDSWKNPIGLFPQLARAIDNISVEKHVLNCRKSRVLAPVNDLQDLQDGIKKLMTYNTWGNRLSTACDGEVTEEWNNQFNLSLAATRNEIKTNEKLTRKQLKDLKTTETEQLQQLTNHVLSDTVNYISFKAKLTDLSATKERLTVELNEIVKRLAKTNGPRCAEQLAELMAAKATLTENLDTVNKDIADLESKVVGRGQNMRIINIETAKTLLELQLKENRKTMEMFRRKLNKSLPPPCPKKKQPVQTTNETFPGLSKRQTITATTKPVWVDPKPKPVPVAKKPVAEAKKPENLSKEDISAILLQILQRQPIISDDHIMTSGNPSTFIDMVCAAFEKKPSLIIC